jgi:small subunit ribosomal protein S16
VAVKIRLKRMGKIRAPHYRIVVADSRTKRDGRVIEEIGKYHPKEDPSFIEVNSERAQYWLGVGAQPSEPVAAILKVTGDWQRFKGESAPPPMLVAESRRAKTDIFNDALKDVHREPQTEAVTPRRSAARKTVTVDDTAAVEEAVAESAPAEETAPVTNAAAADEAIAADAPAGAAADEAIPADAPAGSAADEAIAADAPAGAAADEAIAADGPAGAAADAPTDESSQA